MSHLFTMGIILNQIFQLHVQYSGLNLIQTRIASSIFKYILLLRAIVSQGTDCRCQFGIIGGHCSTITKSTKVLSRIETMSSSITNRTGNTTIGMLATMRLSVILNQFEIEFLAEHTNSISIGIASVQVHNSNSLGSWSYSGLNEVIINLKCIEFRLNQNRLQSVLCDGKNRGNIGICRHYHLVSWLHYTHLNVCTENPDEGIQTIGTTNGIFCSYKLRVVLFKPLVLFSLEIPASIYYTAHCLVYFCPMKGSYVF